MAESTSIKPGLDQSRANTGPPLETNLASSLPSPGSQEVDLSMIARVHTLRKGLFSVPSTSAFASDTGDAHDGGNSAMTQTLLLPPATSTTPPELTSSTRGPYSASPLSVNPNALSASFSVTNHDLARDLETPYPVSQPPSLYPHVDVTPPQMLVSPPSYADGVHTAFSSPSPAQGTKVRRRSFPASSLLAHHTPQIIEILRPFHNRADHGIGESRIPSSRFSLSSTFFVHAISRVRRSSRSAAG